MNHKEVLLTINNLRVCYHLDKSVAKAVDGFSCQVRKGECFGIVGESGSGKTTLVKSILKLLPYNGEIVEGRIYLKGSDITDLNEKAMDRIRWRKISVVTQSAMNSLNPVARISEQMLETFLAHDPSMDKKVVLERCQNLFEMVGLNKSRIFDFPHQFSGGMRQRVIIAMAIALDPELIIADEPTTALDVIMQAQIVNLLRSLAEKQGISIILITHNIALVAEICQSVAVMYAGRCMEYGDISKVFGSPLHPYTMGLKGAFPTIKDLRKTLISIPGSPPALTESLEKCVFSERCPFSTKECEAERPEMGKVDLNHWVACHRIEHASRFREEIEDKFRAKMEG
jgi:oligopeptide/dipeptide ABC transporter ATP-binding protein